MSPSPASILSAPRNRPHPGAAHATCAWCGVDFATITDLLHHVDLGHLVPSP